jgi:small subunit ribosomal protein S1
VKILEIDSERRRLSLSAKRVEGQVLPLHPIELSDEDLEIESGAEDPGPPVAPEALAEPPAIELDVVGDADVQAVVVIEPAAADEAEPAAAITADAEPAAAAEPAVATEIETAAEIEAAVELEAATETEPAAQVAAPADAGPEAGADEQPAGDVESAASEAEQAMAPQASSEPADS